MYIINFVIVVQMAIYTFKMRSLLDFYVMFHPDLDFWVTYSYKVINCSALTQVP